MMPDLSVIVPTYNESSTISKTIIDINTILKQTEISFEILIVDDNSPDGTAHIVESMIGKGYPVRLINRDHDPGLAQSVVEGFKQARGNIIVVTDCDESHDYSKIPSMYDLCKTNDIVIGSRYALGGKITNWPIERRIISLGATFLSKVLFPYVTDPVSGFFAVQKSLVDNAPLKPRGYKILLEILGKTYWRSFVEIPYEFKNRKSGKSKMRAGTIIDFLHQVFDIARFPGRSFTEIQKMKRFLMVGASGILTNMFVLTALKESGVPLIGASFLATECAIIGNFLLNDSWTFGKEKNANPWLHRLITFNGISVGGMLITVTVLVLLTTVGVHYLISNLVGILIAFSFNFLMNRKITWAVKTKV